MSCLKIKISKKLGHGFVDERALITTTLYLPVNGKSLYLFSCERKTGKRIFNTNSKLSQIRTEKQIKPSKTTINWLFHDI